MVKKKQDNSINGWLLVWVVATILLLLFTLVTNYDNLFGWIIIVLLGVSLAMVLYGKGSRWFVVVAGFILGLIFLWSIISITTNPLGAFGVGLRGGLAVDDMDAFVKIAQNVVGILVAYDIYLIATGFYFIFSKRVKARFDK